MTPLVISVSGIRGIVGESLTPEVVAAFAAAHGAARREATGRRAIVLGRDARVSGPVFATAAEAGLRSVGCDVVDVGVACTPTILFAIQLEAAAGAIAITASHNPAEWNALKLASERGIFLTPDEGLHVRAIVEAGEIPRAPWNALGGRETRNDATARHLERILADPLVDVDAVRERRFRVALDTCAGAGSVAMVPLLDALGVSVEGLHLEPTGRFPRDPEPTPENLGELSARVRTAGTDLGLAIDPDGDRLALIDERGEPLGEDLTLALVIDYVLGRRAEHDAPSGASAERGRRSGPVVTNLSTSQVVEYVAEEHGTTVERTAVGEVNVALRMLAVGSPIGGEGNGGVIYPGVHHTRDAPAGVALLLSHLARSGRTLRAAAARFPVYSIRKTKLPLARVDAADLLARAADAFNGAQADRTDGLRLAWPQRGEWLHLRASGTEPIVRVIAEARDPARAEALVQRAQALAESA
ncbi:MAG TPA: phosphoglucosamine mutase [Gemmatimonadota bacterium]|nr:phosphoglucosamine mutase [Gemmatimonadota bacterium]